MLRYVPYNVQNKNVPHVFGGFGFPSHENDVTTCYRLTDKLQELLELLFANKNYLLLA